MCIQELFHARLCVIVLAHVHVRVSSHVSFMCLCVRCGGGYDCALMCVRVRVHVRVCIHK